MTASVWELEASGMAGTAVSFMDLQENSFYEWNSEAMLAVTHGLEDLALEEASGALLTTFPDAKSFEAQRERYWQLAATLDQVEVVTSNAPKRCGRVRFLRTEGPLSRRFWLSLYEGRRQSFAIAARQLNDTSAFDERLFRGFFTCNPGMVSRLKREVKQAAKSRSPELVEFFRLERIDLTAKETLKAFARETLALQKEIRRLQQDGFDYPPTAFAANLEKSFARLDEWKDQLCSLASQHVPSARK